MRKKINIAFTLSIILILQSCYFGAGLVESSLTDNFSLFANSSLEEMRIYYYVEQYHYETIVDEAVFAVGYNDDFIIAKRHPKDSTNHIDKNITTYHIINIADCKAEPKESVELTEEEFRMKRTEFNLPKELDFTIVYKEIE